MGNLNHLLQANADWAAKVELERPGTFEQMSKGQTPRYLWICCADSRVQPSEMMGLAPGELFVHRNVANRVSGDDPNAMSVIEYAVNVLLVTDIIVCGHHRCGGVMGSVDGETVGHVKDWIHEIGKLASRTSLDFSKTESFDRLAELNVLLQILSLCETQVISEAWSRGQELAVHGWIYLMSDGLLKDLGCTLESFESHRQLRERWPGIVNSKY